MIKLGGNMIKNSEKEFLVYKSNLLEAIDKNNQKFFTNFLFLRK